jgi:hypothetical protein
VNCLRNSTGGEVVLVTPGEVRSKAVGCALVIPIIGRGSESERPIFEISIVEFNKVNYNNSQGTAP